MLASRHSRTTSAQRVRSFFAHAGIVVLTIIAGKPVSHQFAKELLAGFAGAEVSFSPSTSYLHTRPIYASVHHLCLLLLTNDQVDKLAETKGEDWFDREKTKRAAKEHAERMYDEHYVDNQGADQYDPNQYGRPERFERRGW